jgi:hypothetical protein
MLRVLSGFAWLLVLVCSFARAEEVREKTPADPDFAVQGEYLGELSDEGSTQKVGVQVIALGRGKFRTVGYLKGLPGDGTEKSKRLEWTGETSGGVTAFKGSELQAQINGGALVVTSADKVLGKLARVARRSSTLGMKPPAGSIVLFDGSSVNQFDGGKMTDDKLLMPGTTTKPRFQSGTLHVEFQTPFAPEVPSRGNSGVYLQSRYEVQILDSFGFDPHNHECGGIPSIKASDVMMSYPPLQWQTYDVDFTAAQFQDGKKVQAARMTVRHNGVVIHNDVEVPHATTSSPWEEGREPGPIHFQEHGAAVRFRHIWFLPR